MHMLRHIAITLVFAVALAAGGAGFGYVMACVFRLFGGLI